jgi:transcriptional regulator with XRE-family HTH domain
MGADVSPRVSHERPDYPPLELPELPALGDEFTGEAMTDAELCTWREYLGLSRAWVAKRLSVSDRMVRKWELGESVIPEGVRQELAAIMERTAEVEAWLRASLHELEAPAVLVYRTDAALDVKGLTFGGFPATWWRALVARVAQDFDTLAIRYDDSYSPEEEWGDDRGILKQTRNPEDGLT